MFALQREISRVIKKNPKRSHHNPSQSSKSFYIIDFGYGDIYI